MSPWVPTSAATVVCPKCKSKEFRRSEDLSRPLVNIGGKESFQSFDVRRYVCVCCGLAFKTKEEYWAEIQTTSQPKLPLAA